eukprot:scaffold346022_cov182-Cyclotella_meneghiniana.AAC.1
MVAGKDVEVINLIVRHNNTCARAGELTKLDEGVVGVHSFRGVEVYPHPPGFLEAFLLGGSDLVVSNGRRPPLPND